ncbi:MAG: N-acetyltransferase family protein [Thermoleophilia bacterium]
MNEDRRAEREALEIRSAGPDDAGTIADIHIATWRAAYAHVFGEAALASVDPEQRERSWRTLLAGARPPRRVLVAGPAGAPPVGFAAWSPTRDPDGDTATTAELCAIYVLPSAWGTGVGRLLMDRGVALARRDGFLRATLWVLADNPRAQAFYRRSGWRPDGADRTERVLGVTVGELRYATELLTAPTSHDVQ